jgi:hypothetical protein
MLDSLQDYLKSFNTATHGDAPGFRLPGIKILPVFYEKQIIIIFQKKRPPLNSVFKLFNSLHFISHLGPAVA